MIESQRFKHIKGGVPPQFKRQYNMLVDTVNKMQRSLFTTGFMDSTGFLTRRPPVSKSEESKIFDVQHVATAGGDGIYDCYEQTLDATEWDDTDGTTKFDDKDSVEVEVLNLYEYDPEVTYVAQLVAGDLLKAWKMTDDEGTSRWVGIPLAKSGTKGIFHKSYCKAAAGASTNITCFLDVDTTGVEVSVACNISGGGNLNSCIRRLADGDLLLIWDDSGTWRSVEGFTTTEDCDCS